MATFIRAICRLPRLSLIPADDCVNVWHFDADSNLVETVAADVASRLVTFYAALDNYLADTLTGSLNIKCYDMTDAEPRVPVFESTDTLTIPVGSNYPAEVALCLSMRASIESGVNMKRRRGRVFLGPLSQSIGNSDLAGDTRPTAGPIGTILTAAENLASSGVMDAARLAVYSPTTHATESLADSFHDVEHLSIDNVFDTMRSRGAKKTVTYAVDVT